MITRCREEIIVLLLIYRRRYHYFNYRKTSRELFEIREQKGQSHKYDFLTVGSMGHSSTIALAIALNKPDKRVVHR